MTKPVDDLLPLPLEPLAVPYMDLYHDALHELVCFGTHILAWNLKQGKGKEGQRNEIDLAVPLLFRHIIELIDAVAVQVKVGVIVPTKVQLRALLEAQMSLEYMLEKDRKRRAACFLIVDHYRKLNFYKKLAADTVEHKKLAADLKEHGDFLPNFSPVRAADGAVKNQEHLVANPIYAEVRKEYLARTNQNTKNLDIKWYALYDGPNSVIWLARRLKKFDVYEFFYRAWSNPTHGTDLSTGVLVKAQPGDSRGTGAFIQLRNLQEAYPVVSQTIMFTLTIFHLMATKVVPEHKKEFGEWHQRYRDQYRDSVERHRIEFDL